MLFQKEEKGDKGGQVLGLTERLTWSKPLLNFASNNFLPLGNDHVILPPRHYGYNYYCYYCLLIMVYFVLFDIMCSSCEWSSSRTCKS